MLESIQKAFHGNKKDAASAKDGKHGVELNGSSPRHSVEKAAGNGEVLKEGVLGVARKEKQDQRFVVLHRHSLVCYKDSASAHNSGKPKWRIALSDINDVEEVGAGLRLAAGDSSLTLRTSGAEELRAWKTALEEAIAGEKVQHEEPLLTQAPNPVADAKHEVRVVEQRAEVKVMEEHAVVEGEVAEAEQLAAAPAPDPAAGEEEEVVEEELQGHPGAGGVLHEGLLGVEFPGRREREERHFVLRQDRLLYFARRADAGRGGEPEGTILVADIEDLEIMDTSFTIHLRGGKSIALHQTGPAGELEAWLEAFHGVLDGDAEVAAQHGTQQVHEGSLQYGSGDSWEVRHAILYFNRLDFFRSQGDAASGAAPASSLAIGNIAEVEPVQSGFDVRLVAAAAAAAAAAAGGPALKLRPRGAEACSEWLRAWDVVLGAGFQRWPEGGWTRQDHDPSHPHPPTAPTCVGDVTVVSCKGWSEPRRQHCVLYSDRLEHYDDARGAAQSIGCRGRVLVKAIRSVQVQDDAFHFALDDHPLIIRITDASLMEKWIRALRSILEPDAEHAGEGRGFDGDEDELDGFAEPNAPPTLRMSLLSAANSLVTEGFLGFQHEGRLARRYCRLFSDRLEEWASGIAFEKKQAPVRRLFVKDIWGIELIGGGFVLNHLGSKLGVHVGAPGELQTWAGALRSVLSLSPPAASRLQEQIQGGAAAAAGGRVVGSASSTPSPMQASPSNASSPISPRRSPDSKKALVPRVAGLAKPPPTREGHIRSDGTQAHHSCGRRSVVRSGSFVAARLPHKKDHVCRSAGTLDSMRVLHRPLSPGNARREVNEKVNAHVSELLRGCPVAEKVTGTARVLSPRPTERFDKISHVNGERQVARARGGGSAELTTITGKVTEPGGKGVAFASPLACMRSPRTAGVVTQKI